MFVQERSERQPSHRRRDRLRQGFAAGYPPSKKLDQLLEAFRAGDYRRVRKDAARLARKAKSPEVRRAAADLGERLAAGRLEIYLFLLPVALLILLAAHYLLGH